MSTDNDCEILVVGLGPVGQLLSLLLGRAGVSVVAIDEAAAPFDLPRAAVVDDEVLRIFQWAGVADAILSQSQVQEDVSFVTGRGRRQRLLRPTDGIHGHPGLVSIHQPSLEAALIEAVEAEGSVEMRRSVRLDRIDDLGSRAVATVSNEVDERDEITARWVVGCDGGSSRVRQLLGIEFGGSTFRQRWLVVDVSTDRPIASIDHPHFFGDFDRPAVSLPMSPGRHRWEWMLHPGEDAAPFLDDEAIDRRISPWLDGEDVTVERAVIYTFHRRMASRWRERSVFLAGDAAHLMPPFAGQGFSSGARDAANLAWKLEAALRGAPETLLDSYEAERRPHAQAMGRLAVALGKFVQTTDRRVALVRDLFLGGLEVTGVAGWAQRHVKPVPAYGEGAFAERPTRLASRRSVGSQFPQPKVIGPDGDALLDALAGSHWSAVAIHREDADELRSSGVQSLVLNHDFEDVEGVVEGWLETHGSTWVLLRPDRFVFAHGASGDDSLKRACDALHRQLGRSVEPSERLSPRELVGA